MSKPAKGVKKGDKITKEVIVEKIRKGIPTVLKIDGDRYVLEHKNQYKG